MSSSYRTVMVGFGAVAYGYELNKDFLKEYPIPTHYAAVKNNGKFDFDTVVDVDEQVVISAQRSLNIPYGVQNVLDVPDRESVEIVIVACPPSVKKVDILKAFPKLKGVILEKPLGIKANERLEFESYVEKNNIQVQVAYLRRSDEFLIGLKNGGLHALIGRAIKSRLNSRSS